MYQTVNMNQKVESHSAVKNETKTEAITSASEDSIVTTNTHRFYTDSTVAIEIKKEQNGKVELTQNHHHQQCR